MCSEDLTKLCLQQEGSDCFGSWYPWRHFKGIFFFLIQMNFFQCGCNVCDDSSFLCIRLYCLPWYKFISCTLVLHLHLYLKKELAILYLWPMDKFRLLRLKWGDRNFGTKWFTPSDTVKMLKDWTCCATKFVLFLHTCYVNLYPVMCSMHNLFGFF